MMVGGSTAVVLSGVLSRAMLMVSPIFIRILLFQSLSQRGLLAGVECKAGNVLLCVAVVLGQVRLCLLVVRLLHRHFWAL